MCCAAPATLEIWTGREMDVVRTGRDGVAGADRIFRLEMV